jgi:hypothetical protein
MFQHEEAHRWWGELCSSITGSQDAGVHLELETGGERCALNKRVNRAVTSLPPRYVFHFSAVGNSSK